MRSLLELGDPRTAHAELALKANLTERMRFIHLFSTWHGDLASVPDLLRAAEDAAFRSGLCLAVADVVPAKLSPSTLRDLGVVLTELYTSAPDGGTHGAADCALRRRGFALPTIPPTQGPVPGRHWFVNRHGMTFIAVEPGWFHPLDYDRPANADGWPPQTIVLTRLFFMGDQEVTAQWYRRFLNSSDHPKDEELTAAAARL